MTAGLMWRFTLPRRIPSLSRSVSSLRSVQVGLKQLQRSITNAPARHANVSDIRFTNTHPNGCPGPGDQDRQPPNERDLKLGKTIRILHERLPTLLVSPLPQEILSPQITLHLFPSTHPHLPTVSGKIGYTAALWTAPVAWGRVPVVGNVKLTVLSERMVQNGGATLAASLRHEKLIVKWKTSGKNKSENGVTSEAVEKIAKIVGKSNDMADQEFCGLFIFEFDEEGRIVNHTIEHAEEGGNFDKTAKFISVTDYLLGRAWGKRGDEGAPSLAFVEHQRDASRRRRWRRE